MSTIEQHAIPASWLPRPEDELLHEPFGDPSLPWKETFFIAVRDEKIDATLNMHMTVSANRTPPVRAAVAVAQGARSVNEVHRSDGIQTTERIGNELARIEPIHLSWDSDHTVRWIGTLPDVDFELTLKGVHHAPLWDTMFRGFYATGKSGQVYCHAEQVFVAEGWLQWKGGERLPFSGFGWRDRGWGRRKTQLMWNSGWDLLSAILPDGSAFSVIALRSHEIPPEDPQPVAGWIADGRTLVPCVAGSYHKEDTAFPKAYDLRFADGRRIAASKVRQTGSVVGSMQESEVGPEAPGWAAVMRDHWAIFADGDGQEFPVFTQNGFIHKVDAFRNARFFHESPPGA